MIELLIIQDSERIIQELDWSTWAACFVAGFSICCLVVSIGQLFIQRWSSEWKRRRGNLASTAAGCCDGVFPCSPDYTSCTISGLPSLSDDEIPPIPKVKLPRPVAMAGRQVGGRCYLTPYQKKIAARILNGERAVITPTRKMGQTALHRLIEESEQNDGN